MSDFEKYLNKFENSQKKSRRIYLASIVGLVSIVGLIANIH